MPAIVGFCKVEVKELGPVQAHEVALVAVPVNVKVLPSQMGLGVADAEIPDGTVQPIHPNATQLEEGLLYASKHWVDVLNISILFSVGPAPIASRSAVVILGISRPLLLPGPASISSIALVLGVAPVELIPTPWGKALTEMTEIMKAVMVFFKIIFIVFSF